MAEPEKFNESFNDSLNFSNPEPAPLAPSPALMEYEARKRGPKKKFYERITMLERMYNGDTTDFLLLDSAMRRYYREQYPEYFDRDNKTKKQQREENAIKAARIRHERLQREYRR